MLLPFRLRSMLRWSEPNGQAVHRLKTLKARKNARQPALKVDLIGCYRLPSAAVGRCVRHKVQVSRTWLVPVRWWRWFWWWSWPMWWWWWRWQDPRGGYWGGRLIIDSWDPRRLLAAESIFTAKLNSINSESRAVMLAGSRGVVRSQIGCTDFKSS